MRGTQRVTVDGVEYILAPEFVALDAIESRLDVGGFDLVGRFARRDFRFRDLYTVLLETSRAAKRPIPEDRLAEFVVEKRVDAIKAAVNVFSEFFPDAREGGDENPPAAATS